MSHRSLTIFISARPNYPKAWTLQRALEVHMHAAKLRHRIVHTGQHVDAEMGVAAARSLRLDVAEVLSPITAGSDASRIGQLLCNVEAELKAHRPDAIVVIGDVNGTLAAAVVGSRLRIPVVHLEAGLRSHDDNPEEVNRRAISTLSRWHLCPSDREARNLRAEGVQASHIQVVGNSMAECYLEHAAERRDSTAPAVLGRGAPYCLLTVHKPRTIANPRDVASIAKSLVEEFGRVIFPIHPRTKYELGECDLEGIIGLNQVPPQGYSDFGALAEDARVVVTDSDGVHEECMISHTPCLVLLPKTARPDAVSTLLHTTASLRGPTVAEMAAKLAHASRWDSGPAIEGWDTHVSARIGDALEAVLEDLEADDTNVGRTRTGTGENGMTVEWNDQKNPRIELIERVAEVSRVTRNVVQEVLEATEAIGALVAPPRPEDGHHITRFVMYQRIQQFFNTGDQRGRVIEISGEWGAVARMFDADRIEYEATDPSKVDVQNLPFDSESADFIICDQVIEHVADPFRAIEEMRRVLRYGGWLIVATAFMDPVHERADNTTDYWRFTPRGLAQALADFALLYQCEGWGNREALNVVLNGGARKYVPVKSDPGLMSLVHGRNEYDVPLSVWAIAQK